LVGCDSGLSRRPSPGTTIRWVTRPILILSETTKAPDHWVDHHQLLERIFETNVGGVVST
jgi:hypothetical protein